jgi:multidrug resistance efflux pump
VSESAIPVPMSMRLRRARYQLLPVVAVLICAGLAIPIWRQRAGSAIVVGEASSVRISVDSRWEGVLTSLPHEVQQFDAVTAGQVIARLDTTAWEMELTRLRAGPATAPSESHMTTVRVQQLQELIDNRDIRSPIAGTVMEVHRRSGQAVRPGQIIMVIASGKPDYIVSYVRQQQPVKPAPGMAIEIRKRTPERTMARTYVQGVAEHVELVPEHQLRDTRTPEWGTPVRIEIPANMQLKPGELVDVLFRSAETR